MDEKQFNKDVNPEAPKAGASCSTGGCGCACSGGKLRVFLGLGLLIALAVLYVPRVFVAETPGMFDESVSFVQASESAADSDKAVLAVVTANYCMMCQIYKRNALVDESVAAWIAANAETVYIKTGDVPESLKEAADDTLPVTLLIRDGEVVRSHGGKMSAEELMSFLTGTENAPATVEHSES